MEWLKYLMGGGAAATLWTIFRGVQMLRTGTDARTSRAVADLERWRQQALDDAAWYLDLAGYWQIAYAAAAAQAEAKGVALAPLPPLPQRPPPRIQET